MALTFGVLIEILEDWIRTGKNENRIVAQIKYGDKLFDIPVGCALFYPEYETLWLVTKTSGQEDIFDDSGVLLNDESPKGVYRDIQKAEWDGININTPIGLEIWFTDGSDDLQYRLESHNYEIKDSKLMVQHVLVDVTDDDEAEFLRLLNEQYA